MTTSARTLPTASTGTVGPTYGHRTAATEALDRLLAGEPTRSTIDALHLDLIRSFLVQRAEEASDCPARHRLRAQLDTTPPPAVERVLRAPQATYLLVVADRATGLARLAEGLALEAQIEEPGDREDPVVGWTLDGRAFVDRSGARGQPSLVGGVVLDRASADLDALLEPPEPDEVAVPIGHDLIEQAMRAAPIVNPALGTDVLGTIRQLRSGGFGAPADRAVAITQGSHPGLVVLPSLSPAAAAAPFDEIVGELLDQLVLVALDTIVSKVEAIDGWYGSDHGRGIGDPLPSPFTGATVSGRQLLHDIVSWCGWMSFVDARTRATTRELEPLRSALATCRELLTTERIAHWHLQPAPAELVRSLLTEALR